MNACWARGLTLAIFSDLAQLSEESVMLEVSPLGLRVRLALPAARKQLRLH
jgi:hypothetical protein